MLTNSDPTNNMVCMNLDKKFRNSVNLVNKESKHKRNLAYSCGTKASLST